MTEKLSPTDLIALALHTRELYTRHLGTLNENVTISTNNVSPDAVLQVFDQNHFAAIKVTKAEMQHLANSPEELKEVSEKYKDGIEAALKQAQNQGTAESNES